MEPDEIAPEAVPPTWQDVEDIAALAVDGLCDECAIDALWDVMDDMDCIDLRAAVVMHLMETLRPIYEDGDEE